MARFLRIWEKKRGRRRTGSKLVGSLGEAAFFATLFLVGFVLSTVLIASRLQGGQEELYSGFWVWTMVLASFLLIGGGGLIYTVLDMGVSAERRSALRKKARGIDLIPGERPITREFPNVPSDTNLTNSPGIKLAYRLPSSQSPAWRLLASTMFFIVWIGITTILTYAAVHGMANGNTEWLLNVSLLPVFAVAVWSGRYLWRQIRIHMGIGPTSIEVSEHPLRPGNTYRVFLSQAGRLGVVSLEVILMCEEQATYRHGTDVRTETHAVYRQQLLRKERFVIDSGLPFEQDFELPIPNQVMHSFQGSHNAVHWKLIVRGVVKRWPRFERSFPLVVVPPPAAGEDENGATD